MPRPTKCETVGIPLAAVALLRDPCPRAVAGSMVYSFTIASTLHREGYPPWHTCTPVKNDLNLVVFQVDISLEWPYKKRLHVLSAKNTFLGNHAQWRRCWKRLNFLEERRKDERLCMLFKISKGLVPSILTSDNLTPIKEKKRKLRLNYLVTVNKNSVTNQQRLQSNCYTQIVGT